MRREVSAPRTTPESLGREPPDPLSDGVVTLRLPQESDVPILAGYALHEPSMAGMWIGGLPPGTDPAAWAAWRLDQNRKAWTPTGGTEGAGLIIDAGSPFVGHVDFTLRPNDAVEITYGIVPHARGRGFATRATRLAADWAIGEGGFSRAELLIDVKHAESRRVAEKAGFEFVEEFETYIVGTGMTVIDALYVRTHRP